MTNLRSYKLLSVTIFQQLGDVGVAQAVHMEVFRQPGFRPTFTKTAGCVAGGHHCAAFGWKERGGW